VIMETVAGQSGRAEGVGALAVCKAEAARMLSLSPRTVQKLTRAGRLAAVYVGRKPVYPVVALAAFLSGGTGSGG
jgi:hypothetical protein